jgi:ribose-phosphate pyrophosphokinase
MTALLLFAMPGNEAMAQRIAGSLGADVGSLELRTFPDGESYLRFATGLADRQIALVYTLDHPDAKMLQLLFAAAAARDLGVSQVGLIAPYLAYLRQDRRFRPGEAVTSREVARLLSGAFDWLVTVDPHLHRYTSLAEIYRIPTRVAHAAPLISQWIKTNAPQALVIGPDGESEQWVSVVAREAGVPFTVLQKVRNGDRDVAITLRDLGQLGARTPVFVDDIISSGRTMAEAIRLVAANTSKHPVCIAVHGLFADNSDRLLAASGARVVTSNTVVHPSNGLDVAPLLAAAVNELVQAPPRT